MVPLLLLVPVPPTPTPLPVYSLSLQKKQDYKEKKKIKIHDSKIKQNKHIGIRQEKQKSARESSRLRDPRVCSQKSHK